MVKWPSPKFWGGRLTQTNTFLKVYTKILNFLKVLGWLRSGQPSDYTPDRENRRFNTLKSELLWDYVIVLNKFSWILLFQKFVNISAHNTLNYHILLLKICPGALPTTSSGCLGLWAKKLWMSLQHESSRLVVFFGDCRKNLAVYVCYIVHLKFEFWRYILDRGGGT